jgi:beta-glucanase (GH16 family)
MIWFRTRLGRWMTVATLVVGVSCTAIALGTSSPDRPQDVSPSGEGGSDDPELVWSDEFDGPAGAPPDPAHWTHETGGGGWGNDELQYYTDRTENSSLDGDGHLLITVRAVDPTTSGLACWYGPCAYTSARLITEHKQVFQYGRVEARIRVPAGGGLWPAIWMLGSNIRDVGWPQSGEIDIMEFVGRSPNEIFGTIHGPGYSGADSYSGLRDVGAPVGAAWHDVALGWSPQRIAWEIDGVRFHEVAPGDVAPNGWVFEHPFFLLANMAVGGNFGGAVSPDVMFPQTFAVDHIRVYRPSDASDDSP